MKGVLIVFLLLPLLSHSQYGSYPDKESAKILRGFLHDTSYVSDAKELYFKIEENKKSIKDTSSPRVMMPIATPHTKYEDWCDYELQCMLATIDLSELVEVIILMEESRLYGYNTLDSLVAVCAITDKMHLLEAAIVDFILENRAPSVQYFNRNSRAEYNWEKNCIYLPDSLGIKDGIHFLVEETAHAYQWKNYADIDERNLFDHFKLIRRMMENKTTVDEEKTKEYDMPGTLEYDAHTILSPLLQQQLCDIILCYLNESP